MMFHASVERWLAAHHDVVTRTRALALGMTVEQIRGKLERGEWFAAHPGVYVRTASPRSPLQAHLAAAAWGGPGSLAYGRSAAWLWGLVRAAPPRPHVAVALTRTRAPATIEVTRLVELPDAVRRQMVPTADLAHTLLGAAVVMRPVELQPVLDSAVSDHSAGMRSLLAQLQPGGPLAGRRGAARLRQALATGGYGGTRRSTAGESRLMRAIAAAGLPPPRREYEVVVEGERFKLDCAYPDRLFAPEFDGWEDHHTPAQLRTDNRRRRKLRRIGWTISVYTWRELLHEPDRVAAELREDYESASRQAVAVSA